MDKPAIQGFSLALATLSLLDFHPMSLLCLHVCRPYGAKSIFFSFQDFAACSTVETLLLCRISCSFLILSFIEKQFLYQKPKFSALPAYLKQITISSMWKREEGAPRRGFDWNARVTCPAQGHIHVEEESMRRIGRYAVIGRWKRDVYVKLSLS